MKTNKEIRKWLEQQTKFRPDTIKLFDNETFCEAFIGLTYDDVAVYNWDLMTDALERQGMSYDDAVCCIEAEMREYYGDRYSPIVVTSFVNN